MTLPYDMARCVALVQFDGAPVEPIPLYTSPTIAALH